MNILETERLRLRKMTMDDAKNLLKIFSDPVAMSFYPGTKTFDETIKWIKWTQSNYDKFGIGLWIVERKNDGVFVGQCGLVPQEVNGQPEIEIGYLFVRTYWGQGFATEAAMGCRDWGFKHLDSPRLISLIDPSNAPSIRVAERLGMKLSGSTIKWNKFIDVYAISRDTWQQNR